MVNRTPLPANTVISKSFEFGLEVNLGTYASPVWQIVRRISAWAPTYPPATTDTQTYDDQGDPSEDVTGRGFATAFTVQGNRNVATGYYLPEVEAIIAASRSKGDAALLDVRWYHKPESGTPHPTDAGRALCRVEHSRANSGNADTEVHSISLTGKGSYEPIANPFTGWSASAAAKITSITPSGRGAGGQIQITGSGFLAATAVSIAGSALAATAWSAINDSTIVATLPSGSAGTVPVKVTNPAGASADFNYVRIA